MFSRFNANALVLLLGLLLLAAPRSAPASTRPPSADEPVLEVFVREGCPHCAAAERFLPAFARERPWLRIEIHVVNRSPEARAAMIRHARSANVWPPAVPMFVFEGRALVGFDTPARTGPALAALVDEGRGARGRIDLGPLGTLDVKRWGLPLFTLALGLLDGFNPCAMWVLLFLLSMLVRLRDRRRMALISGTFVLASGLVYYAFMAAWLNLFLAVGLSTELRMVLATVAILIGTFNVRDSFSGSGRFKLSIPEAAKPGLYARMRSIVHAESLWISLAASAVLALLVNVVELLCTAGFPAIYTAILAEQGLTRAAYHGFLALYILGYLADDALMVAIAVAALGSRKLTERAGLWLKRVSGAVMLALGLLMLARPGWLL